MLRCSDVLCCGKYCKTSTTEKPVVQTVPVQAAGAIQGTVRSGRTERSKRSRDNWGPVKCHPQGTSWGQRETQLTAVLGNKAGSVSKRPELDPLGGPDKAWRCDGGLVGCRVQRRLLPGEAELKDDPEVPPDQSLPS